MTRALRRLDRLQDVADRDSLDWYGDALQAWKWVGRLRSACRMALEDAESGVHRPFTETVLREVLQ